MYSQCKSLSSIKVGNLFFLSLCKNALEEIQNKKKLKKQNNTLPKQGSHYAIGGGGRLLPAFLPQEACGVEHGAFGEGPPIRAAVSRNSLSWD